MTIYRKMSTSKNLIMSGAAQGPQMEEVPLKYNVLYLFFHIVFAQKWQCNKKVRLSLRLKEGHFSIKA